MVPELQQRFNASLFRESSAKGSSFGSLALALHRMLAQRKMHRELVSQNLHTGREPLRNLPRATCAENLLFLECSQRFSECLRRDMASKKLAQENLLRKLDLALREPSQSACAKKLHAETCLENLPRELPRGSCGDG